MVQFLLSAHVIVEDKHTRLGPEQFAKAVSPVKIMFDCWQELYPEQVKQSLLPHVMVAS